MVALGLCRPAFLAVSGIFAVGAAVVTQALSKIHGGCSQMAGWFRCERRCFHDPLMPARTSEQRAG